MANERILVTGANGFLGREIVAQLVAARQPLRCTDQQASCASAAVEYHQADIRRAEALAPLCAGASAVIHAAGLAHVMGQSRAQAAPFHEVNAAGTANVAQAAARAGVKRLVLVSSVAVYGGSRDGGKEDSGCFPEGPYAESKRQAEKLASEIARASGMALTILRLATLYGEGDPGNVARLMRAIARGRFVWVGDGSNRKSLLHREDAAAACRKVVQEPLAGIEIFNVSAPPCAMREVVAGLAGALGRRVPLFRVPAAVVRGFAALLASLPPGRLHALGDTVRKWLADDVYDGSRFAARYDFQPAVRLEDGLRREVAWFREKGK